MATQTADLKPFDARPPPRLGDMEALLRTVVRRRAVKSRSQVLREGDKPRVAHVLLHGHTFRYRMLVDGRRQITAILVPGDVCDLEAVMRGRADYSVGALTDCILGEIPAERIADPTTHDPEMTRALWRRSLRDQAISREWLVNMGRRDALEKISNLICELRFRLASVGLASDIAFQLHLTQSELADVLGLSCVHINRVLQQLRRSGLIQLSDGTLTVLDVALLEAVAGFDPIYLRLA